MKQSRRDFLRRSVLAAGAAAVGATAQAKTFDELWREEMRQRGWAPGPIDRAILEYAEALGLGSRNYRLIRL